MVEYFPQIEVVLFPFTTMSKKAPTDSLFDTLKERDVGAFGIKPYAAASLFKGNSQPDSPTAEEDNRRARLALRYILSTNTVIPIPGLSNVHQVDNAAKAVVERRELDLAEQTELEKTAKRTLAKLPPDYQWLRNWQYV
jgi:aryl-alcohol dehydrogenase-like predicted oxidoreductase